MTLRFFTAVSHGAAAECVLVGVHPSLYDLTAVSQMPSPSVLLDAATRVVLLTPDWRGA